MTSAGGYNPVRNPSCGVSAADVRDYLPPAPCDRAHVVPDGQICPEHHQPALAGGEEWSAVLYQPRTGHWRLVGTTGDRGHAIAEVQDYCEDGLFEGERVAIARQMRGPWVVEE